MKGRRLGIALLAAAMAAGTITTADASEKADANGPVAARVIQFLSKLDLSEGQKQQVAEVIAENRETNRALVKDLFRSRRDLFETIHAETYDEEAIRSAYRAAGRIEEELAVRRARMAGELKSILTPEQREQLLVAREVIAEKISQRVDYAFAAVDAWVDAQTAR